MMLLTIGLLSFYTVVITKLLSAWKRIALATTTTSDKFISVIISVRNEQKHIEKCIRSILANDLKEGQYEIIVIDDHSTDQTSVVVMGINAPNVRYEQLEEDKSGKKAAITRGVELAKGEWVVCTDGDTLVSKKWLTSHLSAHANGQALAFGMVSYTGSDFFIDMLNLELSSLVGVGGAMNSLGHVSMINGCNYSFSKKVFNEVNGFDGNESLATGDDEFLLRKIHLSYPGGVTFLKGDNAIVRTVPPASFKEFFNQRKRWASKWKHHKGFSSKVAPLLVFLFYLLFYLGIVVQLGSEPKLSLTLILLKMLVDYTFVKSVTSVGGVKMSVLPFIALQIIYPFYAVFFGLASNFGEYHWKGRNHQI